MNIRGIMMLLILGVVAVLLIVELVPILEAERIAVPADPWESILNIVITVLPIIAVAGLVYGAVRYVSGRGS